MNAPDYFKKSMFVFSLVFLFSCNTGNKTVTEEQIPLFKFIFMTDIHVEPERNATQGFNQAIDSVNKLKPDFVITGGDLVMDVLGQNYQRADQLYNLYNECIQRFQMPVYNTMGNHEIFGIYNESGVDKSYSEYGQKMFEKRIGKRYYSFNHKGWHFMILDSVEDTGESSYIGRIDDEQMEWIASNLNSIGKSTPIVVSLHIPLLTTYMQVIYDPLKPNDQASVVTNAKEVINLFDEYNLKLVLQGHMHFLEDIFVGGTHYITGGAVSSKWWKGKEYGLEEGFVVLTVSGDDFKWEYFDYGWKIEGEI